MDTATKKLIAEYKKRSPEIKNRLAEFKHLRNGRDEDIFSELCFCILTPQAKATSCDAAIKQLREKGLLLKGGVRAVRSALKGKVRFHNKKGEYLVAARRFFEKGDRLGIKNKLKVADAFNVREWIVSKIKGLGYKEASHFLRNIGLGQDIAILDRHILKNLKKYGIIKSLPSSLTRKNYLVIEDKMRQFAKRTNIPLEEMDLLFWSLETGFVFK